MDSTLCLLKLLFPTPFRFRKFPSKARACASFLKTLVQVNSEILARTDVLSIRSLNWHLASMQHHAINYYLMYRDTLGLSSSQCEQAEADKHVFRSDMKTDEVQPCSFLRKIPICFSLSEAQHEVTCKLLAGLEVRLGCNAIR